VTPEDSLRAALFGCKDSIYRPKVTVSDGGHGAGVNRYTTSCAVPTPGFLWAPIRFFLRTCDALQFLPDSLYIAHDPDDGRWRHRSTVGCGGLG
jgi:hypothetical protein